MPAALALSNLLSAALVAFTIELDNEFEHRMPHRTADHGGEPRAPWLASMAMWFNCMRFVGEEGVTVAELERLARTPTNLDGMRRWRYVSVDPPPPRGGGGGSKRPRRDAVLRPTRGGRRAQEVWAPLPAETEERWRERFGSQSVDRLRAALCEPVAQLPDGLPDCMPILHFGLFTRGRAALEGDAAGRAAAAELALPVLLARALVAFAVDYEREGRLSLSMTAVVLPALKAGGVPLADLPRVTGVSKEALAMALNFLAKAGCVELWSEDQRRRARLTERGVRAQAAGTRRIASHEAAWSQRFGDAAMSELSAALEDLVGDATRANGSPLFAGLQPYPDGWRASVRPPERLPAFPMVLHRGAYPDGS